MVGRLVSADGAVLCLSKGYRFDLHIFLNCCRCVNVNYTGMFLPPSKVLVDAIAEISLRNFLTFKRQFQILVANQFCSYK